MALKDLITDLGSFYESNPFAAKYKSKAGPTYAQIPGRVNQRSFRYGDDRPDGGSSKQPFVRSVLPDVNSDPTSATGLLAGITREITARVDDLERIGKYLITPKGLQFIAKQQLLSAQNPIVPGRPNRSGLLKGLYNPLNTLAQVAASGTGVHLEKQGLSPIGFKGEDVKYEKEYLRLSTPESGSNRLENLYMSKVVGDTIPASKATPTGISTAPNLLLSYIGGSGITKTFISFADKRVYGGGNPQIGVFTFNSFQLEQEKRLIELDSTEKLFNIRPDFRSKIPESRVPSDQQNVGVFGKQSTRDYTDIKVNKITRVGIGDPGKRTRDRSSLYNTDFDTIDKISALPLYKGAVADLKSHSRDFIRFRFEVIDNDKTNSSTYVHFRAFLGAITDNFGGQWNDSSFVGRGDRFHTYTGFTRDISLSFTVHPQSREEMAATYQKLTYLASTLAPDYSGAGGYMKGNITKLTIGSYFYRIPGFISSLTYTVPEESSWEIAFDSPEQGAEKDQMEVPRHFDVNLNFTPIHNFAPQLMDGTREYALFTPDQANSGQPNRYLPPRDGDLEFFNKNEELIEVNKKGNVIKSSGEIANQVVDSFKTSSPAPARSQENSPGIPITTPTTQNTSNTA